MYLCFFFNPVGKVECPERRLKVCYCFYPPSLQEMELHTKPIEHNFLYLADCLWTQI